MTEGVFDWLALRSWHLPALALLGTHARTGVVDELLRFERVYLVLDNDDAGRAASARLAELLGSRAVPVVLPTVKDVAELATRPDGREQFIELLRQVGASSMIQTT